jgi:soluble lytic murein transglycosylase-like protein
MDTGRIGGRLQVAAAKPAATAKDAAQLEKGRRACKEFESILLYQMLSTMRKAFDSEGESSTDFGGDVFKSMIDEHLSTALARAGGIGLAKLLEQGLGFARAVEAPSPGVVTRSAGAKAARRAAAEEPQGALPAADPPRSPAPAEDAPREAVPAEAVPKSVRLDELAAGPVRDVGGLRPYEGTIRAASKVFGVSADLIRAVILHESGGNVFAVSSKGAKGLMQLTDATAETLGVTNPFNPVQNIFGGARYLGSLIKMFEGDLRLALASYNAGSGAVKKYGDIPPYKETQEYVKKVITSFERLRAATEGTGHVYKS